jgi:hypothetical protein
MRFIVMSQINPFTGAVAQSPQVQRTQAAEKDRHVRRTQDAAKATALSTDQFEHQVESADAVASIHDDQSEHPPKQRNSEKRKSEDAKTQADEAEPAPRLDITG